MSNQKKRHMGPDDEGVLPYRIDPRPVKNVTTFAGLPLIAETFRALGLDASVRRHLRLKLRDRGYTEAQYLEAFALLFAAGGDRLDDFERLREEKALAKLLGYAPPSPDAGRRFLYDFHDETILAGRPLGAGIAWIPPESDALQALHAVNKDAVAAIAATLPPEATKIATVDHDASIISLRSGFAIASKKREAYRHYEGERGYQPSFAVWSELDLLLADEFRDGNVPAGGFNLPLVKRAFEALPPTVEERYFRADSACYDQAVLSYLRHEEIGFAVSADMSASLRMTIVALPETAWMPLDRGRQWAEVIYVPSTTLFEPNTIQPDRYIAIRKRVEQPTLWDGGLYRYFAVVTNLPWKAPTVLTWHIPSVRLRHRKKAGTIEKFHDIAKNDLGMGILPCSRFGADAAWVRLNGLTYNLMSYLRRIALPSPLKKARPKRLRYEIFNLAGVVVEHARAVMIKLCGSAERVAAVIAARYQVAGVALCLSG